MKDEEDGHGKGVAPYAKSPHYKANDEGGYGNPPVSGQFRGKPGPGRPKGSSNLGTALRKVLRKKIEVRRGGKVLKLAPSEVFAERFLETALSGKATPSMMEYAKRVFEQYGPPEDEDPGKPDPDKADYSDFNDIEFAILGGFLTRSLKMPPDGLDDSIGRRINQFLGARFTISRRDDGHLIIEKLCDPDVSGDDGTSTQ